ncbi:hypothetical protein [Rhizobium arsenicireducens]
MFDTNKTLRAFAAATGLNPAVDADGPATVAGDMICNILHWVEEQSPEGALDALYAVRCGIGHYVTESSITDPEDELGPDSHVGITVHCDGKVWTSFTATGAEIG